MADFVLESRVWIGRPRPEVFAFFSNPAHIVQITPPAFHLTLVRAPDVLAAGAVLDMRLRWLGLPVRWRAYIREYDPPFRFVDVQVRGPYARWEHRHRFLEEDEGDTLIEDRVTYRLPLGPLGRLVHRCGVGRQLQAVWDYRTRRLGELVGPIRRRAG
jgi:ligand-binding SRPBCC domain-containing protein